jgi:hypothetical protein
MYANQLKFRYWKYWKQFLNYITLQRVCNDKY